MVTIAKHVEGISLNPLEYLLDDKGKIRLFRTEQTAKNFLKRKGLTEEDMEFMYFEEYKPEDFSEEVRR